MSVPAQQIGRVYASGLPVPDGIDEYFTAIPCRSQCKPEYVQQMTAPLTSHQAKVLQWFARMFGSRWLMQTVGRVFFNTAMPFWCLLAVFLVIMLRKKRKRLLIAVIPLACLFIAFLCFSPVVLIRYAMEMYYMIPVLVAVALSRAPLDRGDVQQAHALD